MVKRDGVILEERYSNEEQRDCRKNGYVMKFFI